MRIWDARVKTPRRSANDPLLVEPSFMGQYDTILQTGEATNKTLEDLLRDMEVCGVEGAVIHAEYEYGNLADELNRRTSDIVRQFPNRFIGLGTVSLEAPVEISRTIYQVKQCVEECGLRGLCLQPSFFHLSITDRRLYPTYALAQEYKIPVFLHTGVNYSLIHPIKNDHPLLIDELACDFPELTIVAAHSGWPWATEMAAVARKHPRVFLEFGGMAPKYVYRPGSGWDALWQYARTLLQDQILYGTDWPVFPMDRAIKEWKNSGLNEDVLNKLFHENLNRLWDAAN